jgi:hypothetical protein
MMTDSLKYNDPKTGLIRKCFREARTLVAPTVAR